VLDRIEFRALSAAGIAFVLVLLLGPGDHRLAGAQEDRRCRRTSPTPRASAQHAASKANVPSMGGILIVGAICGSVLLVADVSRFYVIAGLLVALWLAVVGGGRTYLKLHHGQASRHRQSPGPVRLGRSSSFNSAWACSSDGSPFTRAP
jgi:UDP-N-acetylmuramyl pentapeptide phosphotransferase/UDP-N-acetylglucosamine-1-phosphate transferase